MKTKIYTLCFILALFKFIKAQDEEEIITDENVVIEQENKIEAEEAQIAELKKEIAEMNKANPKIIEQKEVIPSMTVVNPVRRVGTTLSLANEGPCGNVPKQDADTLTNIGDKINTIWEVNTPIGAGNCTVSMSAGLDVNFTALRPIGKDIVYDENFSFSCGRQQGFEFQQFELPKNYACDRCTLQVKWATPKGDFYSCSDLMILGDKSKSFITFLNFPYTK